MADRPDEPKPNPSELPTDKEVEREAERVALTDARYVDPNVGPASPRQPVPPIGMISAGAGGTTQPGTTSAPVIPVGEPVPGSVPSGVAESTKTDTFGVSGTPITAAFLLDLAEYNGKLVGRTAIPIYEQMRRGDDMVWALLDVYRRPLMGAKWDVAEADMKNAKSARKVGSNGVGRPTAAKNKEVAAFVRENLFGGLEFQGSSGAWVSQQWQQVIYSASKMLDFGCAVLEEVWRVDGDKIKLRALQDRQALTFYRWHTENDGETLYALEQYGYRGNNFLNVKLPVEKMVRFTYRQEGANFFGIPLTRGFYTAWFFKDRLKRIGAIAFEKNTLGVPVMKLGRGWDPKDKADAYNFVTQLCAHEMTGLVEPPQTDPTDKSGFRFEVPTTGRSALGELLKWVSYYDVCMARAALAMFVNSGNTPFGNRSTAKEHADFFLLAAQSLADQIQWELQVNTMRRLVWYNFGPDTPLPQLTVANVQARQLEDMIALLKDLSTVGLVISDQSLRDFLRKEIAAPEETRDGLVAIRGETIDVGEAGGPEISGKAGGQIEIGGIKPGQAALPPAAQKMRDAVFYHRLPEGQQKIDALRPGDGFLLSQPVRFGMRPAPNGDGESERWREQQASFNEALQGGRLLIVQGTPSSNEYLKGRFRVRMVDKAGNVYAEHLTEDLSSGRN